LPLKAVARPIPSYAQIEPGEAFEKPDELHYQRLIEAVLLCELGARLERGIERQIEIGRIAGQLRRKKTRTIRPRSEIKRCRLRLVR
jgi:hypothetical protein